MLSKKYLKTIQFILLSSVLLFGYQNCADQVQFAHDSTSQSLELTPSTKTLQQPVKILFLIDPSPSMVDDLDKMNNALFFFLESLKNLPIEVKIESVVEQSAAVTIDYTDPTTKKTSKLKTLSIDPEETEKIRNLKSEAIKKSIQAYVQNELKNREARDEIEMPVCRLIYNLLSPQSNFFVSNETYKDAGAVILISDEDESRSLSESSYCNIESINNGKRYIDPNVIVRHFGIIALKSVSIKFQYDKYDEGGKFISSDTASEEIYSATLSQPVFCSEQIKNEIQLKISKKESNYSKNYKVTGCEDFAIKKTFSKDGITSLEGILTINEVQQFAIQGKLDPYLKVKRDFFNSKYYDSFLVAKPHDGTTQAAWESEDYCTRKSNYPVANKSLNPMTINEFLDYLNPDGTVLFEEYSKFYKCYYEKSTYKTGGNFITDYTHLTARQSIAKYLDLPNEKVENGTNKYSLIDLVKMAIDKKYGLNRLVIYGLYNTKPVTQSSNGKQGVIINEMLRALNGESADLNQNTYNASFDRIRELIFERIVGKSLSVPYSLKHEYVKSVSVKTSQGQILILKEGFDFKISGNVLVFLNYDPAHDDKFLVVIESVPLI